MTISIHTNYGAIVAQNTLTKTNTALTKSMERLATGLRINSAADDAAGLQIASRLEAQTRGNEIATRNAMDGISMMQSAEGALDEVTNIAYRMNDLAIQAANGSNGATERVALNSEYQALASELHSILEGTNFGGNLLLVNGAFNAAGGVTFQVGAGATDTLNVDLETELDAMTTLIGTTAVTNFGDLTTAANAVTEQAKLNGPGSLVELVGTVRATFGASINRLEHTVANLTNMSENLMAAKSRITDLDFASESGNLAKTQMLIQSGAQMLKTTKMSGEIAISLLS
ncbi:flagellin [Vibrio sp. PNB22_3_1]